MARPRTACVLRMAATSPASGSPPATPSTLTSSSTPPAAIRRRADGGQARARRHGRSAPRTASSYTTAATTDSAATRCLTLRSSVGRAATLVTSPTQSSSVTRRRSASASCRPRGNSIGAPCGNLQPSSASLVNCRVWRPGWTPPSRSARCCQWGDYGTHCVRPASTAPRCSQGSCQSETLAVTPTRPSPSACRSPSVTQLRWPTLSISVRRP